MRDKESFSNDGRRVNATGKAYRRRRSIEIEDMDVKNTDVAQLRRSFGRRTPHTDLDLYFDWQLRWKLLHPNVRLEITIA